MLLTLYGLTAVGLGLFLGYLAIRKVEWQAMTQLLQQINPFAIIFAFTAMFAAAYLRGVRWRILLHDEQISATRLFLIEQAGTALDTLSFVHVLDEVVETGILTVRDKIAVGKVLATLAMQRTLEFGTISLLLTGGGLLLRPLRHYWPYLVTGLGLSIAALTALFLIGPALRRLWLVSRFKSIHQFGDAVVLLRSRPMLGLQAFGLSVLQSVLIGCAGWLLAFSLGLGLDPLTMIVVTLTALFFGSFVPGLPLAFGTLEFAVVALLGLWGKNATDAVSLAMGLRALIFLPPLVVAMGFLPNEGLFSIPAVRRLVTEAAGQRHQDHQEQHHHHWPVGQ